MPSRSQALRTSVRSSPTCPAVARNDQLPASSPSSSSTREAAACRVLEELGLLAGSWSFLATAGQVGDERTLVRSAWDLDGIEARYEDFLDLVASRRPRTD